MKTIAILFVAAGFAFAQVPDPGYGSAPRPETFSSRGLVDRTQGDLRQAADLERHRHHEKEVARYENAQRHLSDFDRDMTRGHFDRGKLDAAINDVKDVVDHNTLDPSQRDALRADLMDLREMRMHHDEH